MSERALEEALSALVTDSAPPDEASVRLGGSPTLSGCEHPAPRQRAHYHTPGRQANSNAVRYPIEGTATSGAAGVAEGGDKPPSDLAYSTVDEPGRIHHSVIEDVRDRFADKRHEQ